MAIKLFTIDKDEVINGDFITGKTNYDFAISHLLPLIDRLDIQRKGQNPKFYSRLEDDILKVHYEEGVIELVKDYEANCLK